MKSRIAKCGNDVLIGCCCECKHQVTINKHPSNKSEHLKGKITEVVSYGCSYFYEASKGKENIIISMESKHGECEGFIKKD